MPLDDITKMNLQDSLANIRRVKSVLSDLYYHSEYAGLTFKPVLSSLIDACTYLSSNIDKMLEGQINRERKEKSP